MRHTSRFVHNAGCRLFCVASSSWSFGRCRGEGFGRRNCGYRAQLQFGDRGDILRRRNFPRISTFSLEQLPKMEVKDIGESNKGTDPYVFCTSLDRTCERAAESTRIGQLFLAPTTLFAEPSNQLPQSLPDLYRVVHCFFLNSLLRDRDSVGLLNRPVLCRTELLRASPKGFFHNLFSGRTAIFSSFLTNAPLPVRNMRAAHIRVFLLWSEELNRGYQSMLEGAGRLPALLLNIERDSRCVPRFTTLQPHPPGRSHRH